MQVNQCLIPILIILLGFPTWAKAFVVEAESGKLKSRMKLNNNRNEIYSKSKYKGSAEYKISIPDAGVYEVEFKVRHKDKKNYKIKAGFKARQVELRFTHKSDDQSEWAKQSRSKLRNLRLGKGKHTFTIKAIDKKVYVDAFKVIQISSESGEQSAPNNSASNTPAPDNSEPASSDPTVYNPPAPQQGDNTDMRFQLLNRLTGFALGTSGGLEGPECVVTSLRDSGSGSLRDCAQSDSPRWVTFAVSGVIELNDRILVGNNTTIDGRGADITIRNHGLHMIKKENVILHNLRIQSAKDDAVKVYKSRMVWVDHLSLSGAEDGLLDITEQSYGVTASWNFFTDHNKALLIGSSNSRTADKDIHVTLHHNYFYKTIRRNPLIRYAKVHMYNNVIREWGDGSSGDAVAATYYSQLSLQNNIFDPTSSNSKALRLTVSQYIPVEGYVNQSGNLTLGKAKVFDNQPAKVFDPANVYSYSLDTADEQLYDKVTSQAGRQDNIATTEEPPTQQAPTTPTDEPPTQESPSTSTTHACEIPCQMAGADFQLSGFIKTSKGGIFSPTTHYDIEPEQPEALLRVQISESGRYRLLIENISPSSKEDSVFLVINNGEPRRVNFRGDKGARNVEVVDKVDLNAGENEILLLAREKNAEVISITID